jgi:hypothetical protein
LLSFGGFKTGWKDGKGKGDKEIRIREGEQEKGVYCS